MCPHIIPIPPCQPHLHIHRPPIRIEPRHTNPCPQQLRPQINQHPQTLLENLVHHFVRVLLAPRLQAGSLGSLRRGTTSLRPMSAQSSLCSAGTLPARGHSCRLPTPAFSGQILGSLLSFFFSGNSLLSASSA